MGVSAAILALLALPDVVFTYDYLCDQCDRECEPSCNTAEYVSGVYYCAASSSSTSMSNNNGVATCTTSEPPCDCCASSSYDDADCTDDSGGFDDLLPQSDNENDDGTEGDDSSCPTLTTCDEFYLHCPNSLQCGSCSATNGVGGYTCTTATQLFVCRGQVGMVDSDDDPTQQPMYDIGTQAKLFGYVVCGAAIMFTFGIVLRKVFGSPVETKQDASKRCWGMFELPWPVNNTYGCMMKFWLLADQYMFETFDDEGRNIPFFRSLKKSHACIKGFCGSKASPRPRVFCLDTARTAALTTAAFQLALAIAFASVAVGSLDCDTKDEVSYCNEGGGFHSDQSNSNTCDNTSFSGAAALAFPNSLLVSIFVTILTVGISKLEDASDSEAVKRNRVAFMFVVIGLAMSISSIILAWSFRQAFTNDSAASSTTINVILVAYWLLSM